MKTIVLVGCGKQKQPKPAPAKELYTSALFKASRRYAERVGDHWYILSAKWGLVDPDTELAPYDMNMARMKAPAQNAWAERQVAALRRRHANAPEFRVILLGGHAYMWYLRAKLRDLGYTVLDPLYGKPLGHRLKWLNGANFAEAEAPT